MEVKKEYMPYMKDIFRALPQTLFIKDAEGRYAFTTKVCDFVNGGAEKSIIGKRDYEIQFDKELGMRYYKEDMEIVEKGISTHTIDVVVADGEKHYIEVMKNPICNDEHEVIGICGICNDATELMNIREKYEQLSLHDSLTGLYNRNYIVRFNFDNEKSLPCSYIVCDCNGLKIINDQYGHSIGDEYLCKMAEILKKTAPKGSVIIRWGGDEFVVVTPGCDEELQKDIIKNIKEEQKIISEKDGRIGLAVGGAVRTELEVSECDVLKLADERMYEDKTECKKTLSQKTLCKIS